jgi:predicted secreted protein
VLRPLVVAALLLACALPAGAQPVAAQVELSADAVREVQNDLMNATLSSELTAAEASAVAASLNRTVAQALKTAADWKQVKARSGAYQTYPVYDRSNTLTGWRGRAEIRLESMDFAAMAALIGKLQATLQLAGVSFIVSPELKRQTENELITEAIAAFRVRAEIARLALGARQLRILKLAINAADTRPPRPLAARSSMAQTDAAVPAFEGGTSQVQVTASGTVDLE